MNFKLLSLFFMVSCVELPLEEIQTFRWNETSRTSVKKCTFNPELIAIETSTIRSSKISEFGIISEEKETTTKTKFELKNNEEYIVIGQNDERSIICIDPYLALNSDCECAGEYSSDIHVYDSNQGLWRTKTEKEIRAEIQEKMNINQQL